MKKILVILGVAILSASCEKARETKVSSPDKNTTVSVFLRDGQPHYLIKRKGQVVIDTSALGFSLRDQPALKDNFKIAGAEVSAFDETWEQVWGEKQFIRNHYNQLVVQLQQNDEADHRMDVVFRVFDDGVGFRYIIPEQPGFDSLYVMDEHTEFNMTANHTAWWIPAYQDNRYEYLYSKTNISEMDTVHTPVTFQAGDDLYISLHEAALTDYASYTVAALDDKRLKLDLVPWADGVKVKSKAPMQSPWRTIQIAEKPGDLITSYLILNLNEPNKLEDLSYIKPSKYMGIWWALHIGKHTFWEGPDLGATTVNSKEYIDFAAEHGIPLLLIEGWNKGWTTEWYLDGMHQFSFTQSVDEFDLKEVAKYGQSKGVNLIGYHETGSNLINYLDQIDDGMGLYRDLGIHDIKIGQVGSRLNMKEWHHGQFGVNYYRSVLKKAAEHKLAVNFHEPIKPTGERRTYPNMMTGEGARGMEYNAWSEGNPPEHETILPFTRLLAGPMDYTPGIFDVMIKYRGHTRVHTTVAKQLALYVVIFSPTQMLADLPENYEGHPAFQFLLDVPVDWHDTRVLNAEIGEYITTVRKDRHSDDWYLGSLTNEQPREFEVSLSFLDEGKKYKAQIYADGEGAHWESNPLPVSISEQEVNNQTQLKIVLAAGGGQAIRFTPL